MNESVTFPFCKHFAINPFDTPVTLSNSRIENPTCLGSAFLLPFSHKSISIGSALFVYGQSGNN